MSGRRSLDHPQAQGRPLVSLLVSFSYVQRRSAYTTQDRQPRSRTLLNPSGRIPTDLESVLATKMTPRQESGRSGHLG